MNENSWYGMHQRDNRIWLKRMMKHFCLTRPKVAEVLEVNVSTVDRWLVPSDKVSHRKMPLSARKSLQMAVDAGIIVKEG